MRSADFIEIKGQIAVDHKRVDNFDRDIIPGLVHGAEDKVILEIHPSQMMLADRNLKLPTVARGKVRNNDVSAGSC